MFSRRRMVYGGLVGAPLLALGLAGLAVASQAAAGAAPATTMAVTQPDTNQTEKERFVAAVVARFAARLGKDEAALNAAFVGAVEDATAQAVRDGLISQADATKTREVVARMGLKGMLLQEGRPDRVEVVKNGPMDEVIQAMFAAAAATLGVSLDQIKREDQTIADRAKTRGIDLQRVRDAMLAAGKAKLAEIVQRGGLSQEEARELAAVLPNIALKLTNAPGVAGPGQSVERVLWEAAAKTLGLDAVQLKRALADGKSIADLAQAKGLALQQVKDALLAAGTAHLADLVRQGKLTQAQGDEQQRDLLALIERIVALKPGK